MSPGNRQHAEKHLDHRCGALLSYIATVAIICFMFLLNQYFQADGFEIPFDCSAIIDSEAERSIGLGCLVSTNGMDRRACLSGIYIRSGVGR